MYPHSPTAPGHHIELRELCDSGELFDVVAVEGPMLQGELLRVALSWFMQLASACTWQQLQGGDASNLQLC